VYSRLAGYEDTNDAERLSVDPAMRHVVGERAKDKTAASVSQMGRFETEILTQPKNLKTLINQTGKWVDEVHQRNLSKRSSSTWTVRTVQPLENRKCLLTTVISDIPATILCLYSISMAILNVPCSVMVMFTAVMTGKASWSRSLSGIRTKTLPVIFVVILLLLILIFSVC